MTTSIKITELADIGNAIAPSTLVPVVDMAGTPTTDKANLQIVGNLILGQAGGVNFVSAAKSVLAGTVTGNAQPNITSTGTLTSLTVNGNVNSGNVNSDGMYSTGTVRGSTVTALDQMNTANLAANGLATLARLNVTSTTNLGSVGNVSITGGAPGQVLRTDGSGGLSWVAQSGGGGTPGGSTTQVQFNDAGSFGGNTGFTFNKTSGEFTSPFLAGNGNGLSNIQGGNVSGAVGLATYATTANAVAGGNVSGTVANATTSLKIANGTSNVNIPALNGNVLITSNGAKTWTFDNTGNLQTAGDIVGPANANFTIFSNAGVHDFVFGSDGTFYAPDNVVLGGNSIFIGPGANTLAGTEHAVLIASSNHFAYIQGVINNVSDNGSADWVAQGHLGNDAGGWSDIGFTSSGFGDANYTLTGAGDGYVFAQGYVSGQAPADGGGNLVLSTGENGTTKDIIFGTGGFLLENEFGRISDANNAFELTRTDSRIIFADGTIASPDLEATGNFGFATDANIGFMIETDAGNNTWTFDNAGNLTLPGNTFAVNYANGVQVSIGGGSGNTGNVTFDNNIVIGTGDEFGDGGLYLAPSPGSVANSAVQYLRVRGGDAPTHIHLDTGNNQYYDQYFGNDNKFVKLEAGDVGNVVIGTDDTTGNLYNWTFTSDGNFILANGNSVIKSIANSSLDPVNPNVSTMVLTPDPGYSTQSLVLDPTAPGHIHLRAPGANIDEPSANIFLGGEDSSFEVGYYNGAAPNVFIHSNTNTWTFENTGNLNFPAGGNLNFNLGGITQTINQELNIVVQDEEDDGWSIFNTITDGLGNNLSQTQLDSGSFTIGTASGGNTYSWSFSGNTLQVSSDSQIRSFGSNVVLQSMSSGSGGTASLQSISNTNDPNIFTTFDATTTGANIKVYNGGSNSGVGYTWSFANDGILTFPGTPRIDTSTNNFEVQAAENINFEANAVVNIYTDAGNNAYQWQFGDDGKTTLPTISLGSGLDEQTVIGSQRKLIPPLRWSAVISGTTPTVVYNATNVDTTSMKVTMQIQHQGLGFEFFEVFATFTGSDTYYTVGNRVAPPTIDASTVVVGLGAGNVMKITVTINSGAGTSWVTYDAVEFGIPND